MISGYGNGKFGPNDELTYNQAVTLLVKALGYEKTAVLPAGHNSSIWMDPERSFIIYSGLGSNAIGRNSNN